MPRLALTEDRVRELVRQEIDKVLRLAAIPSAPEWARLLKSHPAIPPHQDARKVL